MSVLVAYASRHGATRELAGAPRRCAGGLRAPRGGAPGHGGRRPAGVRRRRHRQRCLRGTLAHRRPSRSWRTTGRPCRRCRCGCSAVVRSATTRPRRRRPRRARRRCRRSVPWLQELVGARQHLVFSGALRPDDLTFRERMLRRLPAGRSILPEGDFREWDEIEDWARAIAAQLPLPAPDLRRDGLVFTDRVEAGRRLAARLKRLEAPAGPGRASSWGSHAVGCRWPSRWRPRSGRHST